MRTPELRVLMRQHELADQHAPRRPGLPISVKHQTSAVACPSVVFADCQSVVSRLHASRALSSIAQSIIICTARNYSPYFNQHP